MIRYEDQCCGCAVPGYPCRGSLCPNRNVPVVICDICGEEIYGGWDDPRADLSKDYHVCRDCEPDEDEYEDEIEYAEASQPYSIRR